MKGLLFLTLLIAIGAMLTSAEILCVEKDICKLCTQDEIMKDYCKYTGRIIKIICNDGETQYEEIRSCPLTAEDEQIRVIFFQVAMGLIGGLSFWGVQRRKLYSMSLFDSRKIRYIYFILLWLLIITLLFCRR